jgi:TPR repeat protein
MAIAQIPTPPALTVARVTPGGAGPEALIVAELNVSANARDPIAEYRLGILYAVGKGVIRDYSHAVLPLRTSAVSGFAGAQYD